MDWPEAVSRAIDGDSTTSPLCLQKQSLLLDRAADIAFWQRGFFLVSCFVLRRLLASVRSGVAKTRCQVTKFIVSSMFIKCPGCDSTVDARLAVCANCGRCLGCGVKRADRVSVCSKCDAPYCPCCGVCVQCKSSEPMADLVACDCGHPHDAEQVAELVSRHSINKPKKWWQF